VPGRSFEIRYPNGDFEIDAGTQRPPPGVGDTIHRQGKTWKVTATNEEQTPVLVQVKRDSEADPAPPSG
jgi:hypothetical protein